jgi:hypothetical protein
MDMSKPVFRKTSLLVICILEKLNVIKLNGQERKFTGNMHTKEIQRDQVEYNISATVFFTEVCTPVLLTHFSQTVDIGYVLYTYL